MQKEIIAAIADKIKNLPIDEEGGYCTWFPDNLAREITAAIMPLVVPGVDKPDWKDAPEWAEWRTVDEDGTITFWNLEPYRSDSEGNWNHENVRVEFREIKYTDPRWENSLECRPK